MDTTIFRKPETTFNHTFEEITEYARKAKNGDSEALSMSFVCENFPKNSFMRITNKGVFNLYHIRGDAEILSGGKCVASMRLIDGSWAITKNLDDIFCALNYDTGMKMELGEVRRQVIKERSEHKVNTATLKTEEISVGEPV